jgi:peptidoglycan/LPS O-acetylase OafA/YrhL
MPVLDSSAMLAETGSSISDAQVAPAAARHWPERYNMLDGWRGLAALGVLFHHLGIADIGTESVMLFFVISGYCITAAAETGLRRGLRFRSFMWRRVRRIYPPYLLAFCFFVVTRLVRVAVGGKEFHLTPIQWLQNITLTQWLSIPFGPPMAALDNRTNAVAAFWSLQYEEQFYLIVAMLMLLRASSMRVITALLIGTSLVYVFCFGPRATGFFLDYWFHFGLGAAVFYRLCRMPPTFSRHMLDAALVLAAAAAWVLAVSNAMPGPRPVLMEISVTLTFAVVLIVVRRVDRLFAAGMPGRLLMALGLISYSLYLVHQFNLMLVQGVAQRLTGSAANSTAVLSISVVFHLAIATVFWFFCERPFLNRRIVPPQDVVSPADVAARSV